MNDSRFSNMVARLIEETARGRMTWRLCDAPRNIFIGTEDVIGLYFEGVFKGTKFSIYELRYKHFTDEEIYYWSSTNVLAVVDNDDRVLWTQNNYREINELYDDVRRKASGVDRLLDYFR
ncbi:hypothetical protein HX792_07840 [Pseudomonas sp. B6002]|uniref:hypothetical protein n=1 Tax=Pseudomonas sp. B6002 TaxID=2726978 RepID=UPI0015A3AEDB|nr:hypothetical protein [Pseudomonas sp. B6002]NVZ50240.1 hypothetical protein [Pseudomonas sp. B6002]